MTGSDGLGKGVGAGQPAGESTAASVAFAGVPLASLARNTGGDPAIALGRVPVANFERKYERVLA